MTRKEWEKLVVIKKIDDKWEASDMIDYEVGKTPNDALIDLWAMKIRKAHKKQIKFPYASKWNGE